MMSITAKTAMLVIIAEALEANSQLVSVTLDISAKMALQLPSKLAACQISTVLKELNLCSLVIL
jgi:hypothetical protein